MRMPLLMRGPGIAAGKRVDHLVYQHCMYATTCDLAGLPVPRHVEFQSLAPMRALGGELTMLTGKSFYISGMAIDNVGNLYVSCYCQGVSAILEFGPTANGNVAPIRAISGNQTSVYSGGIAVDSAGNIYLNTSMNYTTELVLKFSPTDSGNVAPDSILVVGQWTDYDESIAVYEGAQTHTQ